MLFPFCHSWRTWKKEEKWEKGRETGNHPCGQADEQESGVLGCIRQLILKQWSKGSKRFWKDLWNSLHSCALWFWRPPQIWPGSLVRLQVGLVQSSQGNVPAVWTRRLSSGTPGRQGTQPRHAVMLMQSYICLNWPSEALSWCFPSGRAVRHWDSFPAGEVWARTLISSTMALVQFISSACNKGDFAEPSCSLPSSRGYPGTFQPSTASCPSLLPAAHPFPVLLSERTFCGLIHGCVFPRSSFV